VIPFYHTIVLKGVPNRNTIACHCGRAPTLDKARELGEAQLESFREMDRFADYFMQVFRVADGFGIEVR
jgi:hypothetical protein